MTQSMSGDAFQSNTSAGTPDNGIDPAAAEVCKRSAQVEEDSSCAAPSRTPLQIGDEGLADSIRQRKTIFAGPLAVDHHFASMPVDVLQLQSRNLASTKAKTHQQKQDAVIATTGQGASVAAAQKFPDLALGQTSWKASIAAIGDCGCSGDQIGLDVLGDV